MWIVGIKNNSGEKIFEKKNEKKTSVKKKR